MSTSVRITVAEYDRMIAEGRFEPREEHRVELLKGEIVAMSPIGLWREFVRDTINEWSILNAPLGEVLVRAQNSVGLPGLDSMPQPDIAWVHRRRYLDARPSAADILLLIEISDSSLDKDCGPKSRLYAEAGVADYWVVNIPDQCVEVRRDPRGGSFRSITTHRAGESIAPLAVPTIAFPMSLIFPINDAAEG